MKLSELKSNLDQVTSLSFHKSTGEKLPAHFHITEVGLINRHFIDCGGTERVDTKVNFQIWVAEDVDHRLSPTKLKGIIGKSAKILGDLNPEVEVEYQGETIGRYDLAFDKGEFILNMKHTDCLAKELCGVADKDEKQMLEMAGTAASCCTPGSGCC